MAIPLKIKARCGWQVEFESPIKAQVYGNSGEIIWKDVNVIYLTNDTMKAWKKLESKNPFLIDFATTLSGEHFVIVGPYGLKGGGCGCSSRSGQDTVKNPVPVLKRTNDEGSVQNTPDGEDVPPTPIQAESDNQITKAIKRLKAGIEEKDIVEVTSSLKDLRGVSFKYCIAPFDSARELLLCLKGELIWGPQTWIYVRREIIKMARKLLYVACFNENEKINCFRDTKSELEKLMSDIENRILKFENSFPQNGALSDIKRVRLAIRSIETEEKPYQGQIKNGINLLVNLYKKDWDAAVMNIWTFLKYVCAKMGNNKCAISLALDCLSESVKKLNAYDELREFLINHKNSKWICLYIILDEIEAVILDELVDFEWRKIFLEGEGDEKPGFLYFANFDNYICKNNWRIREKVASGLIKISNCNNSYLKEVAQKKLEERRKQETNSKVQFVINNPEIFKKAQKILENTREESQNPFDKLKESIEKNIQAEGQKQQNSNAFQIRKISEISTILENQNTLIQQKFSEFDHTISKNFANQTALIERYNAEITLKITELDENQAELIEEKAAQISVNTENQAALIEEKISEIRSEISSLNENQESLPEIIKNQTNYLEEKFSAINETLDNFKIESLKNEIFYSDEMKICIINNQNIDIESVNNLSQFQQCLNFESRLEDVENIWNLIGQIDNQASKQLTIAGEKGSGKTELAYEFVRTYKEKFGFTWIIDASEKRKIENSFINIANAFGVTSPSNWNDEVIKQIILTLERQKKWWLLIFDNALNSGLISEFVPKTNGVALITSRDENWEHFYHLSTNKITPPVIPGVCKCPHCGCSQNNNANFNSQNSNTNNARHTILQRINIGERVNRVMPNLFLVADSNQPESIGTEIIEQVPKQPNIVVKNLLVAIRIRPIYSGSCRSTVTFTPNGDLKIANMSSNKPVDYKFDKIFQNEDNQSIFMNIIWNNILSVLSGVNACVIAYGSTGSGKTHTMTGPDNDPGIIFLTIKGIIEKREEKKVFISYVQIYNEKITDLLSDKQSSISLKEDSRGGTEIFGACVQEVKNFEYAKKLIKSGNQRRITAKARHASSSRSHAVLIIKVFKGKGVFVGKILLIDLAGNEKYKDASNADRINEGKKIRLSLLTLGKVINDLSNGKVVNYWRESNLTRILKGSLGGTCKSVIITTISPYSDFSENKEALDYANRAKDIRGAGNIIRNDIEYRTKEELLKIIADQKRQIEMLKACRMDPASAELIEIINTNLEESSEIKYKLADLEGEIQVCSDKISSKLAEVEKWQEEQSSASAPSNIKELCQDILELRTLLDEKKQEKETTKTELDNNLKQLEQIKASIEAGERKCNRQIVSAALNNFEREQERQEMFMMYDYLYGRMKSLTQAQENQNNTNPELYDTNEINSDRYEAIEKIMGQSNTDHNSIEEEKYPEESKECAVEADYMLGESNILYDENSSAYGTCCSFYSGAENTPKQKNRAKEL